MKKRNFTLSAVLFALLLIPLYLQAEATGPRKEAKPFYRVKTENVCMTNNKDMGKKQIPVKVGEKTYYGCCPMCAKNLQANESARLAVDPVSGKKVDKALAVMGAKKNGDIFYFESEETFKAYEKKLTKK